MVPSLFARFVRLLRPQQEIVDEHKQQLLRLLPVRLHLHSNLHPPMEKVSFVFHFFGMARTYKMAIQIQEVHYIPDHSRRFQPLLLSTVRQKTPSETSRLFDTRQVWIKNGLAVDRYVRERSGADRACAVVVLPFVKIMPKSMISDWLYGKKRKAPT